MFIFKYVLQSILMQDYIGDVHAYVIECWICLFKSVIQSIWMEYIIWEVDYNCH